MLLGIVLASAAFLTVSSTASAAVTASFLPGAGVLSVFGDAQNNTITISRNAAGAILVNGGAVTINGGVATVANTKTIQVFGQAGDDTITLSEANGALPAANLFGGGNNDTLTGGSGVDMLFGQAGDDTVLGKGNNDLLFGGADNDTLTGGDGNDQVFGESGNDRMIWNPGDDTDLNEGGDGSDKVEVNGGNGAEQFATTPNGSRVRFDRLNPAPFSLDIGTSENLTVNANGGDDSFVGANGLAPLIGLIVDGGAGNDTLKGGDGADALLGGDGNDNVTGGRGNDIAFLGAGDDFFGWSPGDGSDTLEGQTGFDYFVLLGANVSENFDISANGSRVRLTRNVAAITMDIDDVESLGIASLGGVDNLVVHDLTGTGVQSVSTNLAGSGSVDDGSPDSVVVNATAADDVVSVTGTGTFAHVAGLASTVSVAGAFGPSDRLIVNGLAGDDVMEALALGADAMQLTFDGGDGDDVLIGSPGNDVLLGGAGDDVLIGGAGIDTIDGGPGSNIVIDDAAADAVQSATVVGADWLDTHAHSDNGTATIDVGGKHHTLRRVDMGALMRAAHANR